MPLHKLTDEQRKFAEQRHDLVYRFLSYRGLDIDEYYDIVIFGYLRAVQNYCEQEHLQQYSFSTIASWCMRSAVGNHFRKNQIKTLSLDAPILKEGNNFSLLDCVADIKDDYNDVLLHDELEQILCCCTSEEKNWLIMNARGVTIRELAKMRNSSDSAIRSRMYRTLKKIRSSHGVNA